MRDPNLLLTKINKRHRQALGTAPPGVREGTGCVNLAATATFDLETEPVVNQLGEKPEEVRKELEEEKRRARRKSERKSPSGSDKAAEPSRQSGSEGASPDDRAHPDTEGRP